MSLKTWRVLVIEDEADSMELVQELLGHYGISSTGATSGEDALQVIDHVSPNLVIIDLALPGLDGWEVLKHVRGHRTLSNIPCVAITAFHTAELAEQAIGAGFNAYFAKPIDATSFVRELQTVVSG